MERRSNVNMNIILVGYPFNRSWIGCVKMKWKGAAMGI